MRRIALWGQHLDEYSDMFALTADDLQKNFLEYNSGVSAFNSELSAKSGNCVSCDPWYALDKSELEEQIQTSFALRKQQLEQNMQSLELARYGSFAELINYRGRGVQKFLDDYAAGQAQKRYICCPNDDLPFADFQFDFALVANNFFADLDFQTVEYHIGRIKELARVAKDVRIFPLVDADGHPSNMLGPIIMGLYQENFAVEVHDVAYYLQHRGNAMLRVWARECQV